MNSKKNILDFVEEFQEHINQFRAHMIWEEPRHPYLCINGKFNYGVSFDPETGEIGKERFCICEARTDEDCICDL